MLIFQEENRQRLKNLISLTLPILGTQLAIMGMQFFDTSMSGQAGNADLAGVAIGGNLWSPLATGFSGILMAATPLSANYLGAGENEKISQIIRHGLLLAVLFTVLIIVGSFWGLPLCLKLMELEAEVYRIAVGYCAMVALGMVAFFLTTPLRSLVDTLGYTNLSLKLYLLALPINAFLNYVLIFGKLGLPRLGGIGAGLATGLTYWVEFLLFAYVVVKLQPFKDYEPLGYSRPDKKTLKEYLKIGIPMGCSIFLEVGIFCVMAFFIAKYGTQVIAAHQAAYNFSALIYMIPLSFSIALTISVGIAYGAKDFEESKKLAAMGIQLSMLMGGFYMFFEYIGLSWLSAIYSSNQEVRQLFEKFMLYALVWQVGDTFGAPCQGILRGYKDVNATFWSNVVAFWVICMPVGLVVEHYTDMGPFSYWISLVIGVGFSTLILVTRLHWLQSRMGVDIKKN